MQTQSNQTKQPRIIRKYDTIDNSTDNQFSRTEQLIGIQGQKKLKDATVAIFGLGGVGSYTVEALSRAGIGTLILIDNDVIKSNNINRQIYALHSTIGKLKIDIAQQRILDINPACKVKTYPIFYSIENDDNLNEDLLHCSYIIDAIDTISAKLLLIEQSKKNNIPIISCMGTGSKLNANNFIITDISKTKECPLARIIRHECYKKRIKHVKVLYSPETPITSQNPPASISFVPSVAGLLLAEHVVKQIL